MLTDPIPTWPTNKSHDPALSISIADFGGVDAQNDPALAMALRVSYEEERARQEAAAKAAADEEGGGGGESKVRPPSGHGSGGVI